MWHSVVLCISVLRLEIFCLHPPLWWSQQVLNVSTLGLGLHSIISHKTGIFIFMAVPVSNLMTFILQYLYFIWQLSFVSSCHCCTFIWSANWVNYINMLNEVMGSGHWWCYAFMFFYKRIFFEYHARQKILCNLLYRWYMFGSVHKLSLIAWHKLWSPHYNAVLLLYPYM
jgi:hypothetical protein